MKLDFRIHSAQIKERSSLFICSWGRFGDNENVWQDQETTSGGQEHLFDDLNTEAKGNASLFLTI